MASVFKRKTRLGPVPPGAKLVERRGVTVATWTEADGSKGRAEVSECGRFLLRTAKFYSIQYVGPDGAPVRVSARTTDKAAAEELAARLETEAMQRRRGLIDPRLEALRDERTKPLGVHLDQFTATMRAAGRTEGHVRKTCGFVEAVAAAATWKTAGDLSADGLTEYAAGLRTAGKSARTIQACITAVKAFGKWLRKTGKLGVNPVENVARPNPEADRRRQRRMLLPGEWPWLRQAAEAGPLRYGMDGPARALLYELAITTGLRSGELRALTRGSLKLDEPAPYVVVASRSTKNRKVAKQYVRRSLAARLADHAGRKTPSARLFALPHASNMARMLREDLAAARRAWLAEAPTAEERLRREEDDFLVETNHAGEVFDFHAFRHTTGAWLARAGVQAKVVQQIMRHSTIVLTMETYGHLFPGDEAEAVARMPFPDASRDVQGNGSALSAKRGNT